MFPAQDRRDRLILLCVPTLIVVLGCGISLLPAVVVTEVVTFLTVWTIGSIPLAVLVGHCALSEP